LKGRVAIVTGGATGLGRAVALEFAQSGCGVAFNYLEMPGREVGPQAVLTEAAIKACGVPCYSALCDVREMELVEYFVSEVRSHLGGVHYLVNNAGVGGFGGPLHQLPPESWDEILNTNLRGVYYTTRAFAPMMIRARAGHIINISSLAGKNARPNGAAYAASKWGLNGLSYSMAEELRGHDIRVAVICPGSTNTDLSPHARKDHSKMLQPEDVAHTVAMLVTQSAQSFVSEILLRPTQKP